ncbi:Metal-dependent hydrolase, beta-lactamase superfamily II [Ruminococcus sp. YE71]|uniref:ComEC/Rec2 family competence protein n=1 Tax=unclassified Ruminococcus TaxID=2608920 RepID=UPI00088FBB32|nr:MULTISPECIES: MBL fold metallo-hydrolase [unclassified Ruminococcus]SDA13756.1 Metal-dependent hydrolase, beta-lactamase superfamily II [Ruminococcus sp. YE78]SFW19637.1 Metal-dependent hydrolase, beta-lactamase superfamily II [Ruminococcus sp. YE71]
MKKELTAVLVAAVTLLCGCTPKKSAPELTDGELNVYIFDAGKADAAMIYTDTHAVLIDCGEKGFGKEILEFMEQNDISALDCMIITHFDKDHVGGAAKILGSVKVGQVIQSNSPKESGEYERYIERLDECGITPVTVREPLELNFGDVKYTIDPPEKETYDRDPSNNSSLITTVEAGDCHLLFAGDAKDERMAEFISDNKTDYDFLKVPYHGHYQYGLDSFVKNVDPEYAVITCSVKEPEDAKTTAVLKQAGAKVFLTRKAAVKLTCNGSKLDAEYVKTS